MKEFCAKDLQRGWKETRLEEYTQKYDHAGGLHFFQRHPDARTNPVVFPPRYSRLSYRRSTFRPPPPRSLLRRDDGFFPPPLSSSSRSTPWSSTESSAWSFQRVELRTPTRARFPRQSLTLVIIRRLDSVRRRDGRLHFSSVALSCTRSALRSDTSSAHARYRRIDPRTRPRGAEPGPKEIGRVKEQEISCSFATYVVFPG